MPVRHQHLTHRFDGGWAPGFGKLVSNLPTQTSEVRIPYVLDAKNVFWTLDGGFKKIGGTSTVDIQLSTGDEVMGLFDYWRIGATGTHARRKIAHAGTTIYEDQGSSSWQALGTGFTDGAHPNYCTFNDLLIVANDSTDVPYSWDQTTWQILAGSPPNFSFAIEFKNRVWAAGATANPSRLYYCASGNPEDWSGSGSGFIDISPGDGDEIRGLASFKNELWVFKGPYLGSIHRITGNTPSDFSRITFIEQLPCVSHSALIPFRDDFLFMTPSGSLRSLKATAAFGDYNDAALTFPINDWLIDNLNHAQLKKAWSVTDIANSLLYIAVPTGSSTVNDTVLVYDYQFASIQKPDRWSRITDWNAHCLARVSVSGLPVIWGGGSDGYVRQLNISSKNIDTTGKISLAVDTPYLNYGSSVQHKTINKVGITLSPQGNDTVTFGWDRDTEHSQSIELSQGDVTSELGDAAAPAAGDFMLDESELGGLGFNEVYGDLDEGGDFRWIQYKFRQAVLNDDLRLHAFLTGVEFDAIGTE